jgi:hypothetical protein
MSANKLRYGGSFIFFLTGAILLAWATAGLDVGDGVAFVLF